MTACIAHYNSSLGSQLDAYSRRAARKRNTRRSTAEVLGYTAAAGGLAFAGGDAMGGIQYFDTQLSVTADNAALLPPPLPWDIDGNGIADGRILAGADSTTSGWLQAVINGGLQFVTDPARSGFAARLPASSSISAGVAFGTGLNFVLGRILGGTPVGNLANTTGYVGFLFNDNPGGGGSDFFGWAKVRVDLDPAGPVRAKTTVFEWAYEDVAGAPIHIAARGAVPAPATPLLVLLGLGATGISAYRRRRKEGLARLAAEQG